MNKKTKYILGISAYFHDSAAALICDGEIVAAAEEERFTRIKHDNSFPINALKFCLNFAHIDFKSVDAICYYEKPFLKFERIMETHYKVAPFALRSFLKSIPIWLKSKLQIRKTIRKELEAICDKSEIPPLFFSEHHLSHMASAFYPSAFSESAILTVDGVGEWATATIGHGSANGITINKELNFPHSVGLLYSSFTQFLGFRLNSGEYKVMGLAPYGNENSHQFKNYYQSIIEEIVTIYHDGSIWLNNRYFNFLSGKQMIKPKEWERLFDIKVRKPESELQNCHCNLALALQKVLEDILVKMANEAHRLFACDNLCLAGGVALNCVANAQIQKRTPFKNIFIQPAASDAGGALGAALALDHIHFKNERVITGKDKMKGAYLGDEISSDEIEKLINSRSAEAKHFENEEALYDKVANYLNDGKVVGWVQGRMEFGPRALGNRSILADPRNTDMQKQLNLKIKFRESFRPFAPAILEEKANDYFGEFCESPYMLLTKEISKKYRHPLPADYAEYNIKDKLSFENTSFPAISHVDFSSRLQTVSQDTNKRFWSLLNSFDKLTGCPMLANTSFNVRGEPIVRTAADAYDCFLKTEMDVLVINDFLFIKTPKH